MAKITIASILSGFRSVSAFNTVLQLIGTNLNDKVLYRDNPPGEDNVMKNSLDMNSNTILNLPVPLTGTEPVRFDQLTAFIAGGAISAQEEGTTIVPIPTALNFIGPLITVTNVGGVATMTIVSDAFTALTDTPASLSGEGKKIVRVNSTGTALEFVIPEINIPIEQTGTTYTTVLTDANSLVRINNAAVNTVTASQRASVAASSVSTCRVDEPTSSTLECSSRWQLEPFPSRSTRMRSPPALVRE